jgi:hypothetical protein
MDERLRFVARLLDGEKMAALCREFDISRKTRAELGRAQDRRSSGARTAAFRLQPSVPFTRCSTVTAWSTAAANAAPTRKARRCPSRCNRTNCGERWILQRKNVIVTHGVFTPLQKG